MRLDERTQDQGQPRECAGQHGPRTTGGRARAARNALRHALSLPACSNPALSEEVETLAREIAGPGANAETQELARKVAAAQIDLRRVRYARHQFLSDTLSNQDYDSDANMRMKVKVLSALLRPNPPDMSTETLKFVTSTPARAAQARDDSIARGKKVTGHGSL